MNRLLSNQQFSSQINLFLNMSLLNVSFSFSSKYKLLAIFQQMNHNLAN